MFPFSKFKVAKVVLSMEADLLLTVNTSQLIIIDLPIHQFKLRKNKNSNNKENHSVRKSTTKKEIIIIGNSMIKHVNERKLSRDDSVRIIYHPGGATDDVID